MRQIENAAKRFSILVLIFHVTLDQQDFQIFRFGVTLRAVGWFSILGFIFMYLPILRFADLEYHEEQLNGFYIGPDFHVSSDPQLRRFRVP